MYLISLLNNKKDNLDMEKYRKKILLEFLNEINNKKKHSLAIRIRDDLNPPTVKLQDLKYVDIRGIPIYISKNEQDLSLIHI